MVITPNQNEEARFVAEEVLRLSATRPLGSMAVLYRTHAQSRNFEDAFMRAGIPYSIVGGLRFYERKEIKDAIAYLRLIAYPNDYISLERIINEPPRGLGPASVRRIIEHARQNGLSIIDALCNASEIPRLTRPQKAASQELGTVLKAVSDVENISTHEIMAYVLEHTGYKSHLANMDTRESEARLENLEELLVSMRLSASKGETLYDYLENQVLASDQDMYDEDKDACVMMSLHAAKGLEFDVVFMVGMEEGLLPHARSVGDEHQIEEERRLCYVGMTRARELLYFTMAAFREAYNEPYPTVISRFIKEIPQHLLEVRAFDWDDLI